MIAADPQYPLGSLTHRELLANRARARKAMKRRDDNGAAKTLVDRIEHELERRRTLRGKRLQSEIPPIPALDPDQ